MKKNTFLGNKSPAKMRLIKDAVHLTHEFSQVNAKSAKISRLGDKIETIN